MYTTTFYSFKGGVGRTLALVNVAVELARRGRKVLLVDFDLEAPGLDTFNALKPTRWTQGIVEYVTNYVLTGSAPEATQYLYEVPEAAWSKSAPDFARNDVSLDLSEDGELLTPSKSVGRLWVMPSGKRDAAYASLLNSINWAALYAEHDGYLMFEDLKAQWAQSLAPDYVLIDSRTGHTDVGGICTRHVPDAVVIFFFPNEQNLRGLEQVVKDIRAEATPPRNRDIRLEFVMSNVPDLDDEDRILWARLRAFKQTLGFEGLPRVIHHYNSLSLLNPTIFCVDRPRSRLAREYKQLAQQIIGGNLADREAALRFLIDQVDHRPNRVTPATQLEHKLTDLVRQFPYDADILANVARVYAQRGQYAEALSVLDTIISTGNETADVLLQRARCHLFLGQIDDAGTDVAAALKKSAASYPDITGIISVLRRLNSPLLNTLDTAPGVRALGPTDAVEIGSELNRSKAELEPAVRLLQQLVNGSTLEEDDRSAALHELALKLIGLARFEEAVNVLRSCIIDPSTVSIGDAFNLSMALWGSTRHIPLENFRHVVTLHEAEQQRRNHDPNYLQCIAIAYWAIGDATQAKQLLDRARALITARPGWEFTCWRYLVVSSEEFLDDLKEVAAMFVDAHAYPQIMSHNIQ